ncbi:MAG: Mur ligase domain-containing protein [Bacteroidia bacterium]|nr:Mur ligase domain-containing protein [Bacteroidia bacterium]MDW8236326.1 cyanophycin synthetase [Bacteroidia bacterium]
MSLPFPKRLRMWGIGGVGMSALALHLRRFGYEITGYDREPSPFTDLVQTRGIPVDWTASPEKASEAEGVIFTPAIPKDFPEWAIVAERGLPTWRRAQALAEAVSPYKVISVAGAHGKTSTSAILAWLLHALGESPTAFVGGLMRNFQSNYLPGKGQWAVVEADEYDKAMLLLYPEHAILQSIDPDHLEIYGSAEGVRQAYEKFLMQIKGYCVVPEGLPDLGRPCLKYHMLEYKVEAGRIRFRYAWEGGERECLWSQVGRHFAENAAAALTLLEAIGFSIEHMTMALSQFQGVARRMELYSLEKGHIVVNDYAHHPTEIRRTLESLREYAPEHKLIALFQPHLYSRTSFFARDFAQVLNIADEVVLFPIYAAREPSTPHVGLSLISQHLRVPYWEAVSLELPMKMKQTWLVEKPITLAFMGAGDINLLAMSYLNEITKRT